MSSRRVTVVALCLAFLWAPLVAHHSFNAEFDGSRPIEVTGAVKRLEWTNPHAWLYVDGPDEHGIRQVWEFELPPPNGLMRNGWRRDSLVPGDVVTVRGFRSKASNNVAYASVVLLSDGRRVFAGPAELLPTTSPR